MADDSGVITCDESILGTITASYPVIQRVLSFLSWKDLCRVSRVCCMWRDIANKMKSTRCTLSSTCLIWDEADEDRTCLYKQVQDYFESLYTHPSAVFVFTSENLLVYDYNVTPFHLFIAGLLSPDTQMVGMDGAGIVGTQEDLKSTIEIEADAAVAFLCIPNYPDSRQLTIKCQEPLEDTEPTIDDKLLKAALLGVNLNQSITTHDIYSFHRQFKDVAIAGAHVDFLTCHRLPGIPDDLAVLFYGRQLRVASVLIPPDVQTAEKVEEIVLRLKSYLTPGKDSFAFMFACLGRGEGLYEETTVESTVFHKHFPTTRLIGIFGNGELGCDFSGGACINMRTRESKQARTTIKLKHSYTTVIIMFSNDPD